MKTAALILVAIAATTAPAFAQSTDVRAIGEHRLTRGDTTDSARRFAWLDARRKTWRAVVTRLQNRADVKTLRLTPAHVEVYTAVITVIEEEPGQSATANGRTAVQVRVHTKLDPADVVRRMAALQKDQDASLQLTRAPRPRPPQRLLRSSCGR
jgi:hypothetical protein